MNELDEREIQEIIERVRRRVASAGDARPGAVLRAEAELSSADAAELGRRHPCHDRRGGRRGHPRLPRLPGPGPGGSQGHHRRGAPVDARPCRAACPDGPPGDPHRAGRGQGGQEPPRRGQGAGARGPRGPGRDRRRRDDGDRVRSVRRRRRRSPRSRTRRRRSSTTRSASSRPATRSCSTPTRARSAARRRRSASSTGRSSAPVGLPTSSRLWRRPRSTPPGP